MSEVLKPWKDTKITPPPTDGSSVIFHPGVEERDAIKDEMENPLVILLSYEDEVMAQGCLSIGGKGDAFPYWMEKPEPPKGDDLKGWIATAAEPPKKDGTTYILLYYHEKKWYWIPALWCHDWASSDLSLDGMWKSGTLSHTDIEPDYWMSVPKLKKDWE